MSQQPTQHGHDLEIEALTAESAKLVANELGVGIQIGRQHLIADMVADDDVNGHVMGASDA